MTTRKIEAGRLADTAVTPGSYGNSSAVPVITVDQQGRLTSASATTVDGVSNFTYTSANNTFTIATPAGSSYTASISAVEDMIVNGNTVLGSGATDVVQFNATVNSHIIPAANVTYDLGSTTNRFRDLYLSGTSIYLGGHTISANATHIDIGSAGIATTGTTTGDADLGELTVSGNAAVTGTVSAANLYSSANATVIGTLTTTDAVISGNLTVSGTTTYVNTSTLNIGDNIITLNADETGTPSQNAGFEVERGTSTNVSFVWDETNDRFTTGSEDIFLDDNAKAIFGAGSDLQIFHDGFFSKIIDAGTGDLLIGADNNITFTNAALSENKAIFTTSGAVTLYYANAPKFATTSGGIDVTGTVTAQALDLSTNNPRIRFDDSDTSNNGEITLDNSSLRIEADEDNVVANSKIYLRVDGSNKVTVNSTGLDVTGTVTADGVLNNNKSEFFASESALVSTGSTAKVYATNTTFDGVNGSLVLQSRPAAGADVYISTGATPKTVAKFFDGGDISFYDNTGVTQGFFWDASAQRLGLGTTAVSDIFTVKGSGVNQILTSLQAGGTSSESRIELLGTNTSGTSSQQVHIGAYQPSGGGLTDAALDFRVRKNGDSFDSPTTIMTLTDGNVGIGTDNPQQNLHIKRASGSDTGGEGHIVLDVADDSGPAYALRIGDTADDGDFHIDRRFSNVWYPVLSIDRENGNVGIGSASGAKLKTDGPSGIVQLSGGSVGSSLIYGNAASGHTGELLQLIDKNGNQRVHVSNGGYVGINTASPLSTSYLTVNGSQSFIGSDGNFSGGGNRAFLDIELSSTRYMRIGYTSGGTTSSGGIRFYTSGGGAATASRWEMSSGGDFIPSANNSYDIGSSTSVVRNVYTGDLHLSNEGQEAGNSVDGTKGNWSIQEGDVNLYIINNKTGKKYKFALEEIQ